MPITASLALTLPELILSLGALALLMVAAFGGDGLTRAIGWGAVALLAAAGFSLTGPAGNGGPGFDGLYIADSFSSFAKVLIYIAAAASILIAPGFFARTGQLRAEYPILILLSAVGMGMMVSASDLLTLYVGLELQSLSAYVLASFMRRDTRAAEAGLKYFVLGALASGILLYGISLLYGFTGTTLFAGIADSLGTGISTGEMFGMVFVFAGLAFKISAVPFHMWTPDVYEGAPTPVTAFFASAPKVAGMALLMRVAIDAMGSGTDAWRQIVIFSALASTILGGVAAIGQSNIKRLLAYSSINNVGFALFGLAAGTPEGVAGTLTYMAVYVAMTIGSFLCVLQMRDADGQPVETIASLSGLSRSRPALAAAFAIFMFSLAGIPPLFGFWPKFLVFDALVKAGFWPLAMIGIATSVIGAFYYLKIVKTIYFDEPAADYAPSDSKLEGGLIALSALFVSPLGYLAIPALGVASMAAARSLF
ncbi:NADH-quinone oxidoreductase subunit NuoN [Sphingomonas montanisoli]|uniref:NADH-quinone oxidoreductase subunit N n=1 Tax=Sphingomonas montanisoli TaxID=2606412 RepID=A0A5D9C4L2_9SPHN|nr:NADH-quinone oxidoreductase subunit NuoN [Sphingomonas montanisoli]TZG26152.1 NADH-quinone oxidoreductase subunit NuoN [Sphingomonas montanisoli]